MKRNPAAVSLGKRGGKVKRAAKAAAARKNGRLGGRPKKKAAPLASYLYMDGIGTWKE